MSNATDLLRKKDKAAVWSQYCGFIDLSVQEFMDIQRTLLEEQLERLAGCELGRAVFGDEAPKTVEEFRQRTRFTKYEDFAPFLLDRKDEALPEKPFIWAHTSGRSGEYPFKWIPYTQTMYDVGGKAGLACFILSSCCHKGDVRLREQDISLYSLAPPPYVSGLLLEGTATHFNFRYVPSAEEAREMDFQERIKKGFRMALREGLDYFYGITAILLRVSEQFSNPEKSSGKRSIADIGGPRALLRLIRAAIRARLRGRSMLPRDIWRVKGVLCGGTDTSIFKDKVAHSWGRAPLEVYASTEFGITATQTWSYAGLTFYPYTNFWEFIPEDEYQKMIAEPGFIPTALTLDEVEPNQEYILVGTNFHGGALVRCIIGDMIRITALRDEQTGVSLPQMIFSTRVDGVIDIGGFTRLTEKTIWKAIEDTGIGYVDWTVRKEYEGDSPILHLYMELKEPAPSPKDVQQRVHDRLKAIDEPYRDLETMGGLTPMKVTPLAKGTFQRYMEERQAAGADLAHLKPAHMNPNDDVITNLLRMSSWSI